MKKESKILLKERERKEFKERLMSYYIKPNDTIYTTIKSVSTSGMSRTMSLYVVVDNKLHNITYYIAKTLDYPLVDVNGSRVMRVGGSGMDMGFHVVYSLSGYLFRELNLDGDPGYLLKHEWI